MPIDSDQNVTVLGLGYIGLPTAALIARSGSKVTGVDVSKHVVETVNSGKVHIEEVDLDGLVQGVVSRGSLVASTKVAPADVFVIAVPTPHDDEHRPDISHVLSAARAIAPQLVPGNLVILESTSPVGTTEKVAALLASCAPTSRFRAPAPAPPTSSSPIAPSACCRGASSSSWSTMTAASAGSPRAARAVR